MGAVFALGLLYVTSCTATSSEGTHFVIAFPPPYGTAEDLELRFMARETTGVIIFGKNVHDQFNVTADELYIKTIDNMFIPMFMVSTGIEDKAFEVTSDLPISFTYGVQSHTRSSRPDQILARPLADSADYYVMTKTGVNLTNNDENNFYTISAVHDYTTVTIYEPRTAQTSVISLNRFQTYTNVGGSDNDDFTGTHITANRNISVISGNARYYATYDQEHYFCDMLPPVRELGLYYTSFPIVYGERHTGYFVRVVATVNNTDVHIPAQSVKTLNAGEYLEIQQDISDYALSFWCTAPCLAVQVANVSTTPGGVYNTRMGSIMVPLVPESLYQQDVWFTTPYMDSESVQCVLAIISDTYPVTNLYLNAVMLHEELEWTVGTGYNYAYSNMTLTEDEMYHLYTTEPDLVFAAYVYTGRNHNRLKSKGFAVGYGDFNTEDDINPRSRELLHLSLY